MVSEKHKLKELATLFLKLGFIAFGGPVVHISMMHHEVVMKRKWMDEQHFLDLVGATNLIPGPNSTKMAIHIGRERAGWKGLIIAGLSFILPAVLITSIFAWLYVKYGQLPQVQPFIYGIQPAIIAIILGAVFSLAKKSLKSAELLFIAIAVLILSISGLHEILLLFGAGLFALGIYQVKRNKASLLIFFPVTFMQLTGFTILSTNNLKLFFIFLKVGALIYGSGYVLFAFLDQELVESGLLSRQQLVDAIAAGQFTPGPVFSSVTFIGYQLNGWSGALVSTAGIFLPSFLFVALLNPLVKKIRNSKIFSAFLDAVNAASIALIVAVCYFLGREAITDWRTILIVTFSILLVLKFRKINSALIVAGGALTGYLLQLI